MPSTTGTIGAGRVRSFAVFAAVSALTLAACGASSDDATLTTPATPPGSTTPETTPAGWIGGSPEWGPTDGGDGGEHAATDDVDTAEGGRPAFGTRDGSTEMPSPTGDSSSEPALGPLRAGSVDDNADFERFLTYLARIESLGIPLRAFDVVGRIVVQVTGSSGLPVAGAEVVVAAEGVEVTRVRTTADGTARFHPAPYGAGATTYDFSVGDTRGSASPGESVELTVPDEGGARAPIALDVLFLLDATGSMGDEIGQLKASIDSVAERVSSLEGAPDVRFAMTLYRDLDDAFVTATYDFTSDVAAFRAALAEVVADGGGDYPEALDEGLAEALMLASWRDPSATVQPGATVQMVFLVADAPPQIGREVEMPYPVSIVEAIGRGIKIFPVASSESDDQAEAVFRQLAQATGARFVFLAYGAGGAATGGSTDIARTDYEELALDDLVVRLIAEDLAALTGDAETVPTTTPTTTTVPDGQ
jgi:hypothetical protein